ncbi:MAG TPA: primosomal protein N' [Actinomycetes bacterium]|nr:primosomal protein N' [Actinomycetes bacterium]
MSSDDGQLSLTDLPPAQARRRAARARGPRAAPTLAPDLPVARVAVDISLPHLDRLFDYAVTAAQSEAARAGVRVRVRFAGQLVDGYVIERVAASDHHGRLARLTSVVSVEPVLTPEIARLARTVADRYAGTLADVLRLAVPPRHAAAERTDSPVGATRGQACAWVQTSAVQSTSAWDSYERGPGLLDALRAGRSPRAAWCALPGVVSGRPTWTTAVGELIQAVNCSGRGAIVVVPDAHDVDQASDAMRAVGIEAVALTADLGPRERYRRWVSVLRGDARVVVGTRAAIYAPLHDLGLIVVWDDGDDLHAEPRAPYPHTREVAALRAHQSGVGLVVGGYLRTAEAAAFVGRGFMQSLEPDRAVARRAAPRVRATSDAVSGDDPVAAAARLPTSAWRAARAALAKGPVLIQVPRAGYLPRLSCERCRTMALCPSCQGPLQLGGGGRAPVCLWCAAVASSWRCPECGSDRLRAAVVGASRTAEELGRAFPGTPVLTSGGPSVRREVTNEPALVVATPGAEPVAPDGYAAALLLDTWALLGRADLRAAEEALRRWFAAAALVRGSDEGGHVVLVGEASLRPVQALIRWDPARFAGAELADRVAVGLPPAQRIAVLQGRPADLVDMVNRCALPPGAEQLGPVAIAESDDQQVILRVSAGAGADLAAAVAAAQGERSVRKENGHVTVHIDPAHFG